MRLWSLHPVYLDARGLVACWREGLLAKKVLSGETRGYKHHPQLERFKKNGEPICLIDAYLTGIYKEADRRGYSFDCTKIEPGNLIAKLSVTEGQLAYELGWLTAKLSRRAPSHLNQFSPLQIPATHPLFFVVAGDVESWEKLYVN